MQLFFVFALSMILTSLAGYDFKSKTGKICQGAGIGRISSSGIEVILPSGIELLPLEDVPDELVEKFSPGRKKRFAVALKEYRSIPPEVKAKEQQQDSARKRLVQEGWKMHRNLQLWLKSYDIARSPSEEASLFAALSRAFLREFAAAGNDKERAAVFTAFLKKVKESGLEGEITLDIPKPSMPQYSTPRSNFPINPPRGARSYKVNGKRVSRGR